MFSRYQNNYKKYMFEKHITFLDPKLGQTCEHHILSETKKKKEHTQKQKQKNREKRKIEKGKKADPF